MIDPWGAYAAKEARVYRSIALIILAAVLASCAPTESPQAGLARELAGYTPGKAEACIPTYSNTNLRVIDGATLAYGYGRRIYVNRLASACPALEPTNTLIVDAQGGQYCRGDRVRGLEPGGNIPGPSCNLQDWIPYRR